MNIKTKSTASHASAFSLPQAMLAHNFFFDPIHSGACFQAKEARHKDIAVLGHFFAKVIIILPLPTYKIL